MQLPRLGLHLQSIRQLLQLLLVFVMCRLLSQQHRGLQLTLEALLVGQWHDCLSLRRREQLELPVLDGRVGQVSQHLVVVATESHVGWDEVDARAELQLFADDVPHILYPR